MKQYYFVVIGSGPAGQKAAIQAAKFGKRTAVIERRTVIGGVSVHTGTIPSKTMREAVLYLTGWNQRGLSGIESPGEKAILSRFRALFTHIFEITATIKLRKEIIGDGISEGILTHSIPSSNSYLVGSGIRCNRLKLHRQNRCPFLF